MSRNVVPKRLNCRGGEEKCDKCFFYIFFLNNFIYSGTLSDQGLFSLVVQLRSGFFFGK